MDTIDRNYYVNRKINRYHTSQLSEMRKLTSLDVFIEKVYRHQKACFELNPLDKKEVINSEILSHYFYHNCFIKNKLKVGQDGVEISLDQFIKHIFNPNNVSKHNHIHFLLGEVGSGKTALINYIITTILPNKVRKNKAFLLRLDLNLEDFKEQIDTNKILQKIILKLKQIVFKDSNNFGIDNIEQKINEIENKYTQSFDFILAEIINLIKNGKHIVIIFDNFDEIIHFHDRGIFQSENIEKLRQIREVTESFIKQFRSGPLRNICAFVLFVLRNSTFQRLNNSEPYSGRSHRYENILKYHTLVIEEWSDVIKTRNELFEFAIQNFKLNEGDKKTAIEFLADLDYTINTNKINEELSLNSVNSLANLQLREIVEYLGRYIWLNINEKKAQISNILTRDPLSTITYILGGKKLYSEYYSHFPNIFLNEEIRGPKEKGGIEHTYWLKFLILYYLKSRKNVATSVHDLMSIFSDYDPNLIEDCLGNLTDVLRSNLIRVEEYKEDLSKHSSVIGLTDRCLYCFDHIFTKFIYFQLIVDDHNLCIPKFVLEDYQTVFDYDSNQDYSYLTEYLLDGEDLIKNKIKQVLIFLGILEGTFASEIEIHKKTFSNLKRECVLLPSVPEIRVSILNELIRISNSFSTKAKTSFVDLVNQYENESYKVTAHMLAIEKEAQDERRKTTH